VGEQAGNVEPFSFTMPPLTSATAITLPRLGVEEPREVAADVPEPLDDDAAPLERNPKSGCTPSSRT